MIKRFMNKPSIVGLDIGRVSIKAVQVSAGESGPRLDGALCLRRTGYGNALDEAEARGLTAALDRRGITASRAVVVAPTDALVGGSVSVPPANGDVPRDKIVESELSRTHSLAPGTFEYAWWDLPPASGGSSIAQAHAIALPHAAVASTLCALTRLGLETVRTVPASLALLAAAQRRPIDPRRITAVLDLGATRAHLTLMHAGRVVHERPLPDFNLQALQKQVCESLSVDQASARWALGHYGLRDEPDGNVACETTAVLKGAMGTLAEEVGMSFAYVSHLYPEAELGPLLLAGGGANLPGLTSHIAQALELEVVAISPDSILNTHTFSSDSADTALAAALGAALIGVESP